VKTKYITTKVLAVSLISIAFVLVLLKAGRGGLEQLPALEPTTNNLDEIYNLAPQAVTPSPQPLAFDCFLKIDGVPGESTEDKHKDWIEVLSYYNGMTNTATRMGGGMVMLINRPTHEDFMVTKPLDKSSPKLALYCCNGQHIREVTLELFKNFPGTGSDRFMKYTLSDVIITSVRTSGGTISSEASPIEEVSFNYGKIEWAYTEHGADGRAKGDVKTNWDLTANKGN